MFTLVCSKMMHCSRIQITGVGKARVTQIRIGFLTIVIKNIYFTAVSTIICNILYIQVFPFLDSQRMNIFK